MKPPYRVPTMVEVDAAQRHGLTVASTFTGAGGSCLGFRMAGWTPVWANEFLDHPRVRRDETWGKVNAYSGTEQRTDDLFFEYLRVVREVRPRSFVAENVVGLTRGKARGFFLKIMQQARDAGYKVEARCLDAQWLGVPQSRSRLIIMGVRDDVDAAPVFPVPLGYRYSVRDALPDVMAISTRRWRWFRAGKRHIWMDRPAPCLKHDGVGVVVYSFIDVTDKTGAMRRLTMGEVKRLSGFPDDFQIKGPITKQRARFGKCVPPVMMMHVAHALAGALTGNG